MANDFDRVLKENLGQIFLQLADKYLGFKVQHYQLLDPKLSGTYEREVDHLFEVRTEGGEELLVHFEYQTRDDPDMLSRMAIYHALLYDRYRKPIHHQVIYLGERISRMATELAPEARFERYGLISLREMSLPDLLGSEHPAEMVLGILSNFKHLPREAGIEAIIQRLLDVPMTDTERKRALKQLKILSRLRKLDSKVVKVLKKMPLNFEIDVKKDAFYQWGKEEGLEKGMEKGLEKGIEKGSQIERLESALRFIAEGFSIEQVAHIQQLTVAEIEAYQRSK